MGQATVRLEGEKKMMRRHTECTSAVRRYCALRGICHPIEALLQLGILDECAGVIRVRLWDSRGIGTRTRTRTRALAAVTR
jgi:hypothetical protein